MAIFRQHRINFLLNAHQVIEETKGPFAVAGINHDLPLRASLTGGGLAPGLGWRHAGDPAVARPGIFLKAAGQGIPLNPGGPLSWGSNRISLPGVDLSLAHLMTPYPEGLYHLKGCRLYVNRGIGTTLLRSG